MLSEKQLEEIRGHLNNASNPLFFFDNDADGLCSFLLLARHLGYGKGVAIKSFPDLRKGYCRKLYELNPDYIFILDKPEVGEGFIEEAKRLNLPIVWIDHHEVVQDIPKDVYYYNPILDGSSNKSNEPVSYWAYKIVKNDLWLGVTGCIGDYYIPDFSNNFKEKYPDLWDNPDGPGEALYGTGIGKLARIFDFALKDRTSKVVRMIKKLSKVSSPYEILKEDSNNKIFKRFKEINDKFEKLISKAKKEVNDSNILFFKYGGSLSLSGDIANKLSYLYPDKIVVVAYIKGEHVNISLRGGNVRSITLDSIEDLEGATGGGHERATGCRISLKDLPKFRERVEDLANK